MAQENIRQDFSYTASPKEMFMEIGGKHMQLTQTYYPVGYEDMTGKRFVFIEEEGWQECSEEQFNIHHNDRIASLNEVKRMEADFARQYSLHTGIAIRDAVVDGYAVVYSTYGHGGEEWCAKKWDGTRLSNVDIKPIHIRMNWGDPDHGIRKGDKFLTCACPDALQHLRGFYHFICTKDGHFIKLPTNFEGDQMQFSRNPMPDGKPRELFLHIDEALFDLQASEIGEDPDTGNKYLRIGNIKYVTVDGILHTMTSGREPDCPVRKSEFNRYKKHIVQVPINVNVKIDQ